MCFDKLFWSTVFDEECSDDADWECVHMEAADDAIRTTAWGKIIGHGLRSVQFHSTLAGELMVCLGIRTLSTF